MTRRRQKTTHALAALLLLLAHTPSTAQEIVCSTADSMRVVSLLSTAPTLPTTNDYMTYFGNQLLGTPYAAKTLDQNPTEQLVINLSLLDCTTFVETALALSRTVQGENKTFAAFANNLKQLRYNHGNVAYADRLHYFSSWIEANKAQGFVYEPPQDSLPSLFDETQTLKINYMTAHTEQYPQLQKDTALIAEIRQYEQTLNGKEYKYIPKRLLQRNIKALKKYIHNGDIIAIVTNKQGLDIAHIGLAQWHNDGTLHLLNASQIHKKVIDEPMTLYNYMMKHPSQIGIRVVQPL